MIILIPPAKNMNTNIMSYEPSEISDTTKYISSKIDAIKNIDKAKTYRAIELYDGLMYKNINKSIVDNSVYITTALYGIISAFDKISEHRLDFIQKIEGLNLKKLWNKSYDEFANRNDIIVSLLSSEFEQVFSKNIRDKFIKILFYENINGKLKTHSTISKKCRGKFLTIIMENKYSSVDELKKISFDGFIYSHDLSTDNILYFIKN